MKYVAVLVALCVAVAFSTNCSSPIFNNANEHLNAIVFTYTDPTPANIVCPRLAGGPSCCSAVFFREMEREWNEFHREYAMARINLGDEIASLRRNFTRAVEDVKTLVRDSDLSDSDKAAFIRALDGVMAALFRYLDGLVANMVSCLNVILKYMLGIICLGCRPDWWKYIEESPAFIRFILAQRVCDDLKAGCAPLYESAQVFVRDINQTIYTLSQEVSGVEWTSSEYEDPCADAPTPGDCTSHVCYDTVSGLSSGMDDSGSRSARSLAHAARMVAPMVDAVARSSPHAAAEIAAVFQATIDHSNRVEELKARGGALMRRSQRNENVYKSSGGYEAVEEGTQSGLDSSVSPASQLASLMTALF